MGELPDPNEQYQIPDDPTALAGGATAPFDEEAYGQKVEYLEYVYQQQTKANLAAQGTAFINSIGGHREAGRVDIWEALKQEGASHAYREVGKIISLSSDSLGKEPEECDVFDRVIARVAMDRNGTTDMTRMQAGPDVTDFDVGHELDELAGTPELSDPETLAKATRTIRLLVAHGQYKLNRWGQSDQLRTALDLMTTYTEWVPEFDPQEAGFDDAVHGLTMGLAALQVDNITKPNYPYAKPERSYLIREMSAGLSQLGTTEAHRFLRYNDLIFPAAGTAEEPVEQQ